MGKYDSVRRLSKKEIDDLFIDFAKSLATVRNSLEAANFIKDLLTESEVVIIARRLQIARLLEEGLTYEKIHKVMRVGNTTVAKIHTWMNLYGEGFRTVIKRTASKKEQAQDQGPLVLSRHKKKYPLYHWPELLLEEIVKSAGKKERLRLLKVVQDMKEKTKISKQLIELLKSEKISHTPAYRRIRKA